MEKSYRFDQVAIVQKRNICKSRQAVRIESEVIRGVMRPIPLIASNMSTVVNADFCVELYKHGALGIMHRADTRDNLFDEVKKIARQCEWVGASIGINAFADQDCNMLVEAGANIIVIDIAHGYCDDVIFAGRYTKQKFPHVKVVVGNTVNPSMIEGVADFADAIKIGIASGFCCETKNTSGCYKPQFSAVYDMREKAHQYGIPMISDGGIREPADFTKSIGAGASSVMAGSIFCRCPESAGQIVDVDGKPKKIYSGMASRDVQQRWRGKVSNDCPEGKTVFLDLGEPVDKLLSRYAGALRSGISYAGFDNVDDFRKGCEFILLG